MNDASQNLRRRQSVPPSIGVPLRRLQNSKKRSRSSLSSTVLTGVVACLSGLDPDLKDHLHKVITSLGGAYSREFDAQYVTHLVLDQPFGSKYEFVKNSKQSWAENIAIVTSSWVEACEREGKRASEQEFKLLDEASNDDAEFDVGKENLEGIHSIVKTENPPSIPNEIQHAPLEEACSWMLDQPIPLIFSYQSFLLVGFGEESSLRKDDDLGGANNDSSLRDNKTTNISTMEKLSKLIRRAGGTIYWEPNESISVVVLHNNCSKEVWDDARYFCQNHPRGLIAVTAKWVLCSLFSQTFDPPTFPPEPRPPSTKKDSSKQVKKQPNKVVAPKSAIFRGDIFAIVKLKPPTGTIDFVLEEMQTVITSSGGIILSKQVFEAIKSDAKASAQNPSKDIQKLDRNFYVVSTGGYHLDNANFNPLLADLAKLGVKVVPVNPIWVMTCAYQNIKCNPEDFPLLFQPQTWPIRLLPPPPSDEDTKFLVSVTGFVDISRYGIIHMLKSVGATYTDTLRAKNTHLICKEATGPKYTRAIEWGAHVVSVQWLYHIIQHGYKEGSEEMFTLAVKKECVDEATVMKTENVEFSDSKRSRKNSSHESRASLNPIEQSGKADGAFENRYATSKANRSGCDVKDDAKTADPPTDSRKKISDERNKRLQFALETLQTPAGTSTISDSNVSQRRSLRRRSNQTSILQSNLDEEENTQNDTQYSIRVDDVIGPALGNSQSGDETEVPLSQTIDEGESQMIWYPAMSR